MNEDRNSWRDQGLDDGMIKGDPLLMIREIGRILVDEPEDRVVTEDSMEFPLTGALELIPDRFLRDVNPEEISGETVFITLENLFVQLAKGKVGMTLAELAYYIPLHLIYSAALHDEEYVELPLKMVVKAVGLDQLMRRTPTHVREYEMAALDDPFEEGHAVFSEASGLILDDGDEEPQSENVPLVLEDEPAIAESLDAAIESVPDAAETTPTLQSDSRMDKPLASASETPAVSEMGDHASIHYPLKALLHPESGEPVFNLEGLDVNHVIQLHIPDLMSQLREGIVTISMTSLVESFPGGVMTTASDANSDQPITLDLKETVERVGIEALKAATPSAIKAYDLEWMADPFEEPTEKPDLKAVRTGRQKKPSDDGGRAVSRAESSSVEAPKITAYTPSDDASTGLDYYELPGNININVASAAELTLLNGVDSVLADAITAYRREHDGFKSIFDLFKVDGVDSMIFRRMTGMKAQHKRQHRRRRLASLLKISALQVAGLTAVADAVARKSAFSGCLIVDMDGLLLACAGVGESGADLGAVLPVSLKQMAHNMDLAGLELSGTVSFAVEGQLYSAHESGNVILAVAHAKNMINECDLYFIRKVVRELAWLLSVRAYAGPSV